MYHAIIRPLLFLLSAESAHNVASYFLRLMSLPLINPMVRLIFGTSDKTSYKYMGLDFPSRIGLAAGFDKNAVMFEGLGAMGFGFVEVGTVTPLPQPGNDKPRLFRLRPDKALINRMGFNNNGVIAMTKRLASRRRGLIIGGNIGKNKITPNEMALNDYKTCFVELFPYVDYFVVNVSSPNTPGLRELQDKAPLMNILVNLQKLNQEQEHTKPILLKIAPDLTNDQLDDIVEIVKESGIEGVIATNTTTEHRDLISTDEIVKNIGSGGLSGKPLKVRSLEVVRYLSEKSGKSFVIIGVGGIMNERDAEDFLKAGADLIQVYTGFIYEGPALIKKINRRLKLIN
jgi:dihydroorotate dehydrogenase